MGAGMAAQVDPLGGDPGHRPGSGFAHEGQHGPVVVGVDVDVEQVVARRGHEPLEHLGTTPLAEVDDALEHLLSLTGLLGATRRRLGGAAPQRAPGRYPRNMPNLGGPELLIILLVLLLIFGGTKLPKLARSMGQAQNEFRKGQREPALDEDPPRTPPTA